MCLWQTLVFLKSTSPLSETFTWGKINITDNYSKCVWLLHVSAYDKQLTEHGVEEVVTLAVPQHHVHQVGVIHIVDGQAGIRGEALQTDGNHAWVIE